MWEGFSVPDVRNAITDPLSHVIEQRIRSWNFSLIAENIGAAPAAGADVTCAGARWSVKRIF